MRKVLAGAERHFAGRFPVQIDIVRKDTEPLHEIARQRDRCLKLLIRHLAFVEISDQTDADAAEIAVHIPGREMRPPELGTPALGLDHPTERQAVAVSDQKMIGDHVDRVSGLALAMDTPQQLDIAIRAAAMMDGDVMPAPRPIERRRDQQGARPNKCQQPPPCHSPPLIILRPVPVICLSVCLR